MKCRQKAIFFIIALSSLICLNNFAHLPFLNEHKLSPSAFFSSARTTRVEYGITWKLCSEESKICSCSSGTIRFGMKDRWLVVRDTRPKEVNCTLDALRPNTVWQPHQSKQECWCQHANNAAPPVRVALVTTSNRPENLVPWINYHLGYAGFDHVFIDLSANASTWQSLLPSIPFRDNVTVYLKERQDNYFLSGYQNYVVNAAINLSIRAGLDWIVHIDDDELLYSPAKRSVGDIFANIPDRFQQVQIRNVEALYESAEIKNCFTETQYLNLNAASFVAYANGKSAARLALPDGRHPRCAGVHTFARAGPGKSELVLLRTMERNDFPDMTVFGAALLVVHLESCPFSSWRMKYNQIASRCNESKCFSRFIRTFPFQKQSVERIMNCSQAFTESECSQTALKDFWSSWKIREQRRKKKMDNVLPLDVPWDRIPGFKL